MSEDTLIRAYSVAYWRHNESQLVLCDFPSTMIQSELDKLSNQMKKIVEVLGYVPSP